MPKGVPKHKCSECGKPSINDICHPCRVSKMVMVVCPGCGREREVSLEREMKIRLKPDTVCTECRDATNNGLKVWANSPANKEQKTCRQCGKKTKKTYEGPLAGLCRVCAEDVIVHRACPRCEKDIPVKQSWLWQLEKRGQEMPPCVDCYRKECRDETLHPRKMKEPEPVIETRVLRPRFEIVRKGPQSFNADPYQFHRKRSAFLF